MCILVNIVSKHRETIQRKGDMMMDHPDYQAQAKPSIWQLITTIPVTIKEMITGKRSAWEASKKLRHPLLSLTWQTSSAVQIQQQLEHMMASVRTSGVQTASLRSSQLDPYSVEELELVQEIKELTKYHNRSNISRTAAYLACYKSYPELHWALLAHFVSRNGGYNMTDLHSGLLKTILNDQEKERVYLLLERCNALIFQDAYPQLLLYMKSKEKGRSYFHLLSEFHISSFMVPFWEHFWLNRDSALLTVGLIINEQNYIEYRVIRNSFYQHHVTSTLSFRSHEIAGLNHIVIPLGINEELVGLTLSNFSKVHERIAFGKNLYALLFGHEQVLDRAAAYAYAVPHEGSRSEYWPKFFTDQKELSTHEALVSPMLSRNEALPSGNKLYSPKLLNVWQDLPYEKISREDWLTQTDSLGHLTVPRRPKLFEISHEHRNSLSKLAMMHDLDRLI
ncbi:DUF2515 family protein [Paenibacillus shunpengii]|uniref:DUF2515 family protein n=1 Tax=Paenibacillus shunpengii TaxID=2054424 RepID=A0ABW5SSW9_9BACL